MNGARYAYLNRICELVARGNDIVIVSDDYAAPVLDQFRIDYPKHFVSVGIAEQNLIAVSCGITMAGKRAIAYGCAPFPITRGFDQIKNSVAMMNVPISIVMAGIGFGVPEWGATHYNIDDISIMRSIPGLQIITPTDNNMGTAVADYTIINTNPVYIRFDKYSEGNIYPQDKIFDFNKGFEVLKEGNDITVVTCGSFVPKILKLSEIWTKKGIDVKIIDLFSLPFNEDEFCLTIGNSSILTIEEHVLTGGIGSIVLEMLNNRMLTNKVKRLGVDFIGNYPKTSGSLEYYLNEFYLNEDHITKALFKLLDVT